MDCYFRHFSAELDNMRISSAWLNLCSLVGQVIKVQNLAIIFNPREKHSASQQAVRATTLIGCFALPRNFFFKGLTKENPAIRLAVGRIFQAVFTKINEFKTVLYQNPKANMYSDSEKRDIFAAFTSKSDYTYRVFLTQLDAMICYRKDLGASAAVFQTGGSLLQNAFIQG